MLTNVISELTDISLLESKIASNNFIKKYLVKTSKDYFRLFFIPLIPVGEKSQPFVECQHCKSNWHTNVLDQNNYYLDGTPVTK